MVLPDSGGDERNTILKTQKKHRLIRKPIALWVYIASGRIMQFGLWVYIAIRCIMQIPVLLAL